LQYCDFVTQHGYSASLDEEDRADSVNHDTARLQQPVARPTHAGADHDGVSVPGSSTKPSFHQHRVPSAVNLGRRFMVECRGHGDDLYTAQQGLDLPIGQA